MVAQAARCGAAQHGGGCGVTKAMSAVPSKAARSGNSLWQIFRWPLVLGVLSLFGLLAALVGDGLWDLLGWGALVPALVLSALGVVKALRRSSR